MHKVSEKLRNQTPSRGRIIFLMGLFGVAFIFITFGYIAWEQRNRLIQRNEEDLRNGAFFLADHMSRLMELADLTLKQTDALVDGEDWDTVQASKPIWQQLRAIREALPYIDNVWLNDPSGDLRLTSARFPTPASNAADRDAFKAQVEKDQGLFIGEPIIGRITKDPTFMVSRRLDSPSKTFRGVVSVTISLSYLTQYWGKVRLPQGSRITLIRANDARILAQYPPPPSGLNFLPIDTTVFEEALSKNQQADIYSFKNGDKERLAAYDQVGSLPVYIQVSAPADAYWKAWAVQTRIYGAFALIAFLALAALTALASLQFREQAANAALLESQVAARTRELQSETAALEILNRTGNTLAEKLDIHQIAQTLVEAGVELSGAEVGAFFYNDSRVLPEEFGRDRNTYKPFAISGRASETFAALPALHNTEVFSPTFAEGQTVRSDDITTDSRYGHGEPRRSLPEGHAPVRSYLAVPVLARTGEIYGVLLFGHAMPGVFTERAESLITGLAAQAAIALENGRLYQDAQREIEERKQVQTQQSLLIRELHHRVKNTLATVQAIVGATARSTSNIEGFYKAFVGRIISLANTHSLLTEALWQTASLREILEKELSPYLEDSGERIVLEGPAVELPSEAAVPLGMAIHELATNAVKHGALSIGTGRLTVTWDSEPDPEGLRLRLTWLERGGPPVTEPSRQGFGSRLLNRVLAAQLDAKVDMAFEPEGLRVSLETVLKKTTLLNPVG